MSIEKAAQNAQHAWNLFTADQAIAKVEFEAKWREEKINRRNALSEAIKGLYAAGLSASDAARITGNSNQTFLYALRNEFKAGVNREVSQVDEADLNQTFEWAYHNHLGVHGWLADQNPSSYAQFVKVHGQPNSDYEGQYVIFDRGEDGDGREVIAGSQAFAASITDRELNRRVDMLVELIRGSYSKQLRVDKPNPFRS